jgi:hypothetical protein
LTWLNLGGDCTVVGRVVGSRRAKDGDAILNALMRPIAPSRAKRQRKSLAVVEERGSTVAEPC